MSSIFSRAHRAPCSSVSSIRPGPTGLAETKRAAWAFAIGEHRPSADPPAERASRRGDLPDVDFSQAKRVPRRSVWSRIAAACRAPSSKASALEDSFEMPSMLLPVPAADGDNVIPFRRAA